MEIKFAEDMWCFNCEHRWHTMDYMNEDKCPKCDTKPIRIHRENSTAYVYAYLEKHRITNITPPTTKKLRDGRAEH